MGGTTPTYSFPYPTGTDKVTDGDNNIQALATAAENTIKSVAATAAAATAALETRRQKTVQHRVESIGQPGSGIYALLLSYDYPYNSLPSISVVLEADRGVLGNNRFLGIENANNNNFTFLLHTFNDVYVGWPIRIHWTAVGTPS